MNTLNQSVGNTVDRVILEKAMQGAVPTQYKLDGDDRWHPVRWIENPYLSHVEFSDGSTFSTGYSVTEGGLENELNIQSGDERQEQQTPKSATAEIGKLTGALRELASAGSKSTQDKDDNGKDKEDKKG
jgi:hypothetical protein